MQSLWPAIERIIDANQLRRFSDISRAKQENEKGDASLKQRMVLAHQKKAFIESDYLEEDFNTLELRILDAAKQGKYSVEVIRFNAAFCRDGARAINNHEQDWPTTLQGKAARFHAIWKVYGQSKGYHLKAEIMNFPGGLPGDVSLFIYW